MSKRLFIDGEEIEIEDFSINESHREEEVSIKVTTSDDIKIEEDEETEIEIKEKQGRFDKITRYIVEVEEVDRVGKEYLVIGKYDKETEQVELWNTNTKLVIDGETCLYRGLSYHTDTSERSDARIVNEIDMTVKPHKSGDKESIISLDGESDIKIVKEREYNDGKLYKRVIDITPDKISLDIDPMEIRIEGYYTVDEYTREPINVEDLDENNIDEYQNRASETAIFPDEIPEWLDAGVVYTALGIGGEAGELVEKVKKAIREDDEEYIEEAKKELGDIMWYASQFAEENDESLSDIMQQNLDKLKDRRERDQLTGQGDDR